ncbi:iron-sulfur cluster assembly protein [Beijerinckia sp. L45]|uniref:iron-sulfur cluster assembly protein n=1 Tax=Beijerinckia sp. L45 TaxID=1641855 RepID=UPI00131E0B59|nr:iron-sulfur cluster assembly protein [Beijerinckia sp. L45]
MIAADETTIDAPNAPRWTFDLAIDEAEQTRLRDDIVAALKTVFDPEIPCDIYELGLIYKIDVPDNRMIAVEMTLTAPGCPVAGDIIASVEEAVGTVAGTMGTTVDLVFDPPWDQGRMSDEARISLDMF